MILPVQGHSRCPLAAPWGREPWGGLPQACPGFCQICLGLPQECHRLFLPETDDSLGAEFYLKSV